MKSVSRPGWLFILAMTALTIGGAQAARTWLMPRTRQRLIQEYRDKIAALPEARAARFVAVLAEEQDQWLEVLAFAASDERPLVARVAEGEVRSAVSRWSKLPAEERSSRVATIARVLAETAVTLPPEHRAFVHSLAAQLIEWPLAGRTVDVAQTLADCQTVLLLLVTEEMSDVRVAATPVAPQTTSPSQELELPPIQASPIPPVLVVPSDEPVVVPVQPVPGNEPGRFVPGLGIRISDE